MATNRRGKETRLILVAIPEEEAKTFRWEEEITRTVEAMETIMGMETQVEVTLEDQWAQTTMEETTAKGMVECR